MERANSPAVLSAGLLLVTLVCLSPASADSPHAPARPDAARKQPGTSTSMSAPGSSAAAEQKRIVGTWRVVLWDERDAATTTPDMTGIFEFRADGTATLQHPRISPCPEGSSMKWRLDVSHSPRWLDIEYCSSPVLAGPTWLTLLEWIDEDSAIFQFTPSTHETGDRRQSQFKDGPAPMQRKQHMRRVADGTSLVPKERVVYRTEWGSGGYASTTPWKPAPFTHQHLIIDPEDGESVAYSPAEPSLAQRSVRWHQPDGRDLDFGILRGGPELRCAPVGFLRSRPVILAKPGWYGPQNPPDGATDQRTIGFGRTDGVLKMLTTGIAFDANTRIDRSRLVRTVGADPRDVAGIYGYTVRGFDGEKARLRVVAYRKDGQEMLDGPLEGLDVGEVAYFDAKGRKLVLVGGEVWDIAGGRIAGAIADVSPLFWVETVGGFFTLETKPIPRRPWGLVVGSTGAIIAGGEEGGELVLSRVEVDEMWAARKVELARVVVPLEGSLESDGAAAAIQAARHGQPFPPKLQFRGTGTVQAEWTAVPSTTGLVLFAGQLHNIQVAQPGYAAAVGTLGLWLVVDPQRPGEPIVLPYRELMSGSGYPVALATYPASSDGGVLGLQIYTFVPPVNPPDDGWAPSIRWFDALTLNRATGKTGPVPKVSWRIGGASAPRTLNARDH